MNSKRNLYKTAVGLGYDASEDEIPTLEVKGDQLFADKIVKLAERFGVPIVQNPELAQALNSLEVGERIPEKLFEAVAIVLNRIENKLVTEKKSSR